MQRTYLMVTPNRIGTAADVAVALTACAIGVNSAWQPVVVLVPETCAWSAVALLYAVCTWMCRRAAELPMWTGPFTRAVLLQGVFLCVCLARQFSDYADSSPVPLWGWLVLLTASTASAVCDRT